MFDVHREADDGPPGCCLPFVFRTALAHRLIACDHGDVRPYLRGVFPSHADDMIDMASPSAAAPAHRSRRLTRTLIVIAVVVAAISTGGFFFGRALWWSLRPTPNFPSLVESPDPTLHGTVAYLLPYPKDNCIYVAAASGETSARLTCLENGAGGGGLAWLEDGRLEITHYGDAQQPDDVWRKIVDVKTGAIEDVPRGEIPPWSEPPATVPGPNGEIISSTSERGTLTLTLTTDEGTRSLLSVGAPNTYTFGSPVWGPDGTWFVVKDDLDRLLVVTTKVPSQTRVLVEGGWGQAVTGAELRSGSS